MKKPDLEHIVQDYVYRSSAKELLTQSAQQDGSILKMRTMLRAIASVLLIVATASLVWKWAHESPSLDSLIAAHEMPALESSRGADYIDQQAEAYRAGNYAKIIREAPAQLKSQRDAYYRAHLLFKTEDYEGFDSLHEQRTISDPEYKSELEKLYYLSAFAQNLGSEELKRRFELMTIRSQKQFK